MSRVLRNDASETDRRENSVSSQKMYENFEKYTRDTLRMGWRLFSLADDKVHFVPVSTGRIRLCSVLLPL